MHPTLLAALAMTVATALFAATTLLAKALGAGALGEPVQALQVSQARFVFGFLGVIALAALIPRGPVDHNPPAPHWPSHLARTALGFAGVALMFAAAARMPLADANALSFLSPVVTMMLAIPLLGERVGRWRWIAAAMAFVGAMILIRPGAGVIQPAALMALGAALCLGVEGIFIKRLVTREPLRQVLIINNAIGAVIASAIGFWVFQWPANWAVWAALAGVGLLMVTGQLLFLFANRLGEASYVAPFFYLTLIWAAVYDMAVFAVVPDRVSLLGATVVVAGGVLMAWREALARRHATVLGTRP